ncbi:MAG: 50S ribosomal protein L20 [Deltaproteobacteria bacterium]|nr:50S ribosomal protein L20 [Deltaproteobacteria bacterium]
MARVKRGVHAKKIRKTYFKRAKGFTGGRKRLWKTVRNAVDRALKYAYRDRRNRKRDFRRLWIARLNAAVRPHGMSYSQFIHGLKQADIRMDRKALSNLAIEQPKAFEAICQTVKQKLA